MSHGTDFYDDFANALRNRDPQSRPQSLADYNAERFSIYRNNVYRAHIDALADAYPVIARLVGQEFFEAMAREYYLAGPKGDISLALYGDGLAAFIEDFAPARGLPYLPDMARLERAWLEALHAADAAPLRPGELSAGSIDLPSLRFWMHPTCRLVSSAYPIVSLWHANQPDASPAGDIQAVAETALIVRPGWEVALHLLQPPAAIFTRRLMAGRSVAKAFDAATGISADFDITQTFGLLLTAGVFTAIATGDEQ